MMPYSLTGQIPRPTDGSPDLAQRTLGQERRGTGSGGEVWRPRGGRGNTLTWTRNSLLTRTGFGTSISIATPLNVRSFGQFYP